MLKEQCGLLQRDAVLGTAVGAAHLSELLNYGDDRKACTSGAR